MGNGIVGADAQVVQSGHSPIHKSKFPDLSYHLAGTYRFGEISPHFVAEVENNDKWPLRSEHNVRSFNLKAPMLSDVFLRKNYFQVPMESILPLNWDKVITPPVNGDDVDAVEVNCVIADFPTALRNYFSVFASTLSGVSLTDSSKFSGILTFILKFWISAEFFFSAGSLFSSLNIHLSSLYDGNFDEDFDNVFSSFNSLVKQVYAIGGTPLFNDNSSDTFAILSERFISLADRNKVDPGSVSFGWLLDSMRDDFDWSVSGFDEDELADDIQALVNLTTGFSFARNVDGDYPSWPLNFKRLVAYQLVCHHYFSNDKIDYIYSAELYRQLVYDSLKEANSVGGAPLNCDDLFQLNGLSYRYDYLSGHSIKALFASNPSLGDLQRSSVLNVFRLLFGFNRSLRYLDYFSGSKSQPLAPGDIDTPVSGGKVSSIDITRNIQRQRFFNFVHLVGRKFEEYISKLNGKHVDFDWHNPILLSKGTSDKVYGSEVENNNINPEAADQPAQSTTGTLRGSANTTAFEMEFDRPSVVIGVTWFDIERYYADNIERQNFHINRFDMFNEFMQYVGDQPVYLPELNARSVIQEYFGYKLRHSEYKDRVNQCFGGFSSGALSGWEFIADQAADLKANPSIGPDYIRSRPSEMDPFFLSLSGYSRGTYFHFIIDHYNHCEPVRPMVAQPQILG